MPNGHPVNSAFGSWKSGAHLTLKEIHHVYSCTCLFGKAKTSTHINIWYCIHYIWILYIVYIYMYWLYELYVSLYVVSYKPVLEVFQADPWQMPTAIPLENWAFELWTQQTMWQNSILFMFKRSLILVGGTPLKNDGVRQLGWWNSQHLPNSYGKS